MKPLVAIISARRPSAVEKMKQFAPDAHWLVALGDGEAYSEAGATHVIESGALCESRNLALEIAFKENRPCVQLSDDLTKLQQVDDELNLWDITLDEAITAMAKITQSMGVRLAGVAPVTNTFYYSPDKPVKTQHFIVGDMIYVEPSAPRFDTELRLKEDYDFTAQHIANYGGVARCDFIFASFKHRTNAGGVVTYRTPEIEQESIARLQEKWGKAIRLNPRRDNEVLFDGKKVKRY